MTKEELADLLRRKPSLKKLNLHLDDAEPTFGQPLIMPKSRLKQKKRPLLNALETEFQRYLIVWHSTTLFYAQAITFKLANGVRFTPDFFAFRPATPTAWEVKGKHAWDDALVKLKVAAKEYPHVMWLLVWKENGVWQEQQILP